MRRACLVAALAGVLALGSAPAAPAAQAAHFTASMEVFDPGGTIHRAKVTRPVADRAAARLTRPADVVPIETNGPSENHFDLVVVGDGYTAADLGTYSQHVRSSIDALFSVEPYQSYRKQFNIWQVNVVSPDSGVSNDPDQGIQRNTALGSYFWCDGIERLLCVNETKANQYAAAAPDVDQVLVLANSTKYGGAGGGVATSSGGNASSSQIVAHELGHSIGGLADEYDYGDCDPREPAEPNATALTEDQMRSQQAKWYQYLGKPSPDGSTVGAYEGSRYCQTGMYRPSADSLMRTLGKPFNPPSTDAMIAGFYREAPSLAPHRPAA
ncbi:M64 family metallopeptidase [Amycolatopsis panacis]|uniref:Peptidase M64 n=1 Tax=Amycolatopsis panacis TaxID=2340917 RepID=A0A419I4V9_9PSEU|nr:M64 family metallopeptidase [Amycolatopsis panacis]RJQ85560.1 hypothetical protein D5S19_13475 [Amycolatopsis panacis]